MNNLAQNNIPVKRENKTAVYARFGIVYKNGKILAPEFGFIPELLVNGNEKIGSGVFHFSTLPTCKSFAVEINGKEYAVDGTCPCTCPGCYATKGNYNFKGVRASLAIRTILARDYLDFVRRAILAQIIADGVKMVRIHASGDFFNAEYLNMWHEIVKENPNTIFWTYTKNTKAETAFDDLPNANIVKSIIPNCGLNFGHCDYILNTYKKLMTAGESVYICRCGIDKNQHCVNCKGCATHKYVLFIEHSTEYKALNDPAFPELKTVIESQAQV